MPYKSLNEFISRLEKENELIRISEFVDPVLEITEVTDRISKSSGGGKALLFENTGTSFPVLINAFGSEKRIAMALGVKLLEDIPNKIDGLFKAVTTPKQSLWEKLRLLPLLKEASAWMPSFKARKGQCQEVVVKNPDLSLLPILKCWTYDGGRFVTLPMVHTIDLNNGSRNVGMYRMQIFSKNSTGMHWHRHKTGARHFEEYKKQGKRMPVVVTLGGDPSYTYAATAPLPDNLDEYLLAGFLRGKKVELVQCFTQPLAVPSDVDFVIEGYVDPSEPLVTEGPFGDHTGFYSLEDLYPAFHVTCITHRKDAVYPATIAGIPPQEDAYIAKATERIFLAPIRMVIAPEILDLNLPNEGVSHNIAILKIKKTYPGQAVKIASALWGAGQMMFCKAIVVVSNDVDIHSYDELIEVVDKNFNPTTDTYFSRGPLDVLDHAAHTAGFGGKLCIDATEKLPEEIVTDGLGIQHQQLYRLIHKSQFNGDVKAKITVLFDDVVDLSDIRTSVWILGNNIDISRDCEFKNGSLIIDATIKRKGVKGFNRPWPNAVCSSKETIESINEKWQRLGLGTLIVSPSLKYRQLQQDGEAAISQ
ncbi:MAG: menaquinone biosynthesis decarboxylase [Prevotellaceae bacterium]|jgi:4-hydroxy-3-polyprenylbenzoate decarboxylase|nr:menaquinone biosynthesis decarboxylase [Prevotellaceae bacterium]